MAVSALQKYKNYSFPIVDLSTHHSWLVHIIKAVNKIKFTRHSSGTVRRGVDWTGFYNMYLCSMWVNTFTAQENFF